MVVVTWSDDVETGHIGVRDQFRLGGLRSVARIFSPLLARKSSGFARILPDFLPEYGYFENSRGAAAPPPPPPPPPRTPIKLGIFCIGSA